MTNIIDETEHNIAAFETLRDVWLDRHPQRVAQDDHRLRWACEWAFKRIEYLDECLGDIQAEEMLAAQGLDDDELECIRDNVSEIRDTITEIETKISQIEDCLVNINSLAGGKT